MRKGALAALAVTVLAIVLVFGLPAARASFDHLLGRYPGSARITSEAVDLDYLRRGWLSRQSVYQTNAELRTVERWYVARYAPVSEADAHAGEHCAGFRTSRVVVRIVHAVAVTLCAVPAGTRIVVNESAFFSPPAARAPSP